MSVIRILKTTFLLSIVVLMSGFLSLEKTTLKVEVTNFENKASTKVLVSVFSQKGFLEKPIQEKSISASGNNVIVEFDLPVGEYAVFASQDVNNNGKLDKNFIGKPKELYGFSNNVNPFGSPSYKDCKFTLSNSAKMISIKLIKNMITATLFLNILVLIPVCFALVMNFDKMQNSIRTVLFYSR